MTAQAEVKTLEGLLKGCQDDFRNTLLDVLDELWLDGRERGTLTVPQLNAINAATCELSAQWGLKGWHRAQRIEARSDETPAEAVQPEGREPDGEARRPYSVCQGSSTVNEEMIAPCPFCGGESAFHATYIDNPNWGWVGCSSCGASSEPDTREGAARKWNKRSAYNPNERLREALEACKAYFETLEEVGGEKHPAMLKMIDEALPQKENEHGQH